MRYILYFFSSEVDEDVEKVNLFSSVSGSVVEMGTAIPSLWGAGRIAEGMLGCCKCSFLSINPLTFARQKKQFCT